MSNEAKIAPPDISQEPSEVNVQEDDSRLQDDEFDKYRAATIAEKQMLLDEIELLRAALEKEKTIQLAQQDADQSTQLILLQQSLSESEESLKDSTEKWKRVRRTTFTKLACYAAH